jgi:hypothetical protein
MTIVLLFLIALMMLLMTSRREMAGYIDDPNVDTAEYTESTEVSVTNDLMEKLVLATNTYVAGKTGMCTYIIETTSIKKFIHNQNGTPLYRCMFMVMRQHGFAFGFAVTVDIKENPDGSVRVMGARTQPIDVKPPTDQSPFQSDVEGHVFTEYELFKESELELIKQKST